MMVEHDSLGGQPVEVRRFNPGISVSTEKTQVQAVANHDDDIHGSRLYPVIPGRGITGYKITERGEDRDDWPEGAMAMLVPRRRWFSVAVFLAVTAIAVQLVHKWYVGMSVMDVAKSAQAISDAKRYVALGMGALAQQEIDHSAKLKQLSHESLERSVYWGVASLGLLVLATGCWGVSSYRHEGGAPVLPAVLLIGYVLLMMVMV